MIVYNDNRQNLAQREKFDRVIADLISLLSNYDSKDHYKVVMAYLRVYGLFTDQRAIQGRILTVLGV